MPSRTQTTPTKLVFRKLTAADIARLLEPSPSGVQVNVCKNTACARFGIEQSASDYTIASGAKLACKACGQSFTPMGNRLIEEEIYRLRPRGCPDPACGNHTKPLDTPKAFTKWGRNRSGTPRWRCLACGASFSTDTPEPRRNDRQAAKLMTKLMNKAPLTRACEELKIDHTQLYRALAFIERQALAFANRREQALPRALWDVFNLSTDRQSHTVNWSSKEDRRNATVWVTATCDNDTGYCLLATADFDPSVDQEAIEHQASLEYEERREPPPLRETGRFWLGDDLSDARPQRGALVRSGVHFHAHARLLEEMLHPESLIRLYLDREPGLAAAMQTAFADRIRANRAEAIHLSTLKDATNAVKKASVSAARQKFNKRVAASPDKTAAEVRREMLMEAWIQAGPIDPSGALWATHPVPTMNDPEKKVCWLTHRGRDVRQLQGGNLQAIARILDDASLRGTDVFFMQARRRVSMFERPIHSAANAGRVWNGYGAYNPAVLVRLFNIFRVWKNFAIVGEKDDKTPAMRMGLAKAPKTALQIIRDE